MRDFHIEENLSIIHAQQNNNMILNHNLDSDSQEDLQPYDYPQLGFSSLATMMIKRIKRMAPDLIIKVEASTNKPGKGELAFIELASNDIANDMNESHMIHTDNFPQLEAALIDIFKEYIKQAQADFIKNPSDKHIYHKFITVHAMLFEDEIDLVELNTV